MGQIFNTLIHLHGDIYVNWLDISNNQLCWFLLCYCGNPGIVLMSFNMYVMGIEKNTIHSQPHPVDPVTGHKGTLLMDHYHN